MQSIQEIKAAISSLNTEEKIQLLGDLQIEHYKGNSLLSEYYDKLEKTRPIKCPACSGEDIISKGSKKGVRLLQCKTCKKRFSSTIGTSLYGIHKKDKWQSYIICMEEGLSLRKSAVRVGISLQTSFNWRHKILSSLAELQSKQFKGMVESDEFYLQYSEKGQNNLKRKPRKRGNDIDMTLGNNKVGVSVTIDRTGHKQLKVLGRSVMNRKTLDKALHGRFHPNAVLLSDGHKGYKGLADREGIQHMAVAKLGRPTQKNKAYHIQTVNNLHMQIRQHLTRFNGVSTKYLQNYMNWFIAQNSKISQGDKVKQWLWLCVVLANALQIYNQIKY